MGDELLKIKEIVINKPNEKVENLARLINKEMLKDCHARMDKNKAKGVDNISKEEYEQNLDENLDKLIDRMKKGSYRPQPVKRVYIPKDATNKMRPLGLPSYEDKLVQRAVAEILTVIYEPIFMNYSYGFRPARNCHQAVAQLEHIINDKLISHVVEADIRGFFDNVNHDDMITMLRIRIADKRFMEIIEKFLNAGIMEEGKYLESDSGTPQGGLCSPILANIYLHYTLDLWFEKAVKKQLTSESFLIRYCDDFVGCFQSVQDAERFYIALPLRLAKAHLSVAEEKTKIIEFGRYAEVNQMNRGDSKPETFDFLGFTFYCSKSRNGSYRTKVKSNGKRINKKLNLLSNFLSDNLHMKTSQLIKRLNLKLVGHYRYYGVTDNGSEIAKFYHHAKVLLYKTLNSRSQRKGYTSDGFDEMLKLCPIAKPKIYVNLFSLMNAF